MKVKTFKNTQSLIIHDYTDLQTLDLSTFPEINDFTIQIEVTKKFGLHLSYYSPEYGRLTSFPWWDYVDRDIATWTEQNIPIGKITEPYFDIDQGWHIIIFRKRFHVYVLQGKDPDPHNDDLVFPIWFRVPHQQYYDQWIAVISRFSQET